MDRRSPIRAIESGSPHLDLARLSNCAIALLEHADESGGLGLTPAGALKRVHVNWAAEIFCWPGYTTEELYRVNNVLNEEDMFPLWVIHQLLLETKLARHYKKSLRSTKIGRDLIGSPHRAFNEIIPQFLFQVDHIALGRGCSTIPGSLPDYLDTLNLAANGWISVDDLTIHLLGASPADWDRRMPSLYIAVIRPLVWAGLVLEAKDDAGKKIIRKSSLWHEALELPSDRDLIGSLKAH